MLGLARWPSCLPLPWFLQLFFHIPIDLRIIPHFRNKGILITKEVARRWGWGRGWVGHVDGVSCIYWDLALEMEVEI